jgi:hypothetical protein
MRASNFGAMEACSRRSRWKIRCFDCTHWCVCTCMEAAGYVSGPIVAVFDVLVLQCRVIESMSCRASQTSHVEHMNACLYTLATRWHSFFSPAHHSRSARGGGLAWAYDTADNIEALCALGRDCVYSCLGYLQGQAPVEVAVPTYQHFVSQSCPKVPQQGAVEERWHRQYHPDYSSCHTVPVYPLQTLCRHHHYYSYSHDQPLSGLTFVSHVCQAAGRNCDTPRQYKTQRRTPRRPLYQGPS